jgi:hypothetical protein
MNRFLILFILIFNLLSCTTTTFQPFTKQKYAPTRKVDLYTNEKPTRSYIEIGRIIVGEDAFTGEKHMVKWAIEKARKVGADGLIWVKDRTRFYALKSGRAGEVKEIIFIAIKYKDKD